MSEETNPSQDQNTETEPAPKIRRISNKNPRKAAKSTKDDGAKEQPVPVEEFESSPPKDDASSEEKAENPADPKRKNRRRRGKGKSSQKEDGQNSDGPPAQEETINLGEVEPTDSGERPGKQGGRREPQTQRPSKKPRSRPDSDKVAKNAWKIFLAEVSEEGVALIGDNDARELARRCFRLSEIFMDEEHRRN